MFSDLRALMDTDVILTRLFARNCEGESVCERDRDCDCGCDCECECECE